MFRGCSFDMATMSKAMGGSILRVEVPVPCDGKTPDGYRFNSSECPFNGGRAWGWVAVGWMRGPRTRAPGPRLASLRASSARSLAGRCPPCPAANPAPAEWSDVANDWVRKNTKVNLEDYPFKIYIAPKGDVCKWGGMGYVGCFDDCRSWINGDLWYVSAPPAWARVPEAAEPRRSGASRGARGAAGCAVRCPDLAWGWGRTPAPCRQRLFSRAPAGPVANPHSLPARRPCTPPHPPPRSPTPISTR
jgi:hypothetical protein